MNPILIAVLVVAGLFLIYVIGVYNGLIHKRIRCEEGWSDIDVQLKRRYDLIPNLLETVKGYATHEKELLTKVTELRSEATKATLRFLNSDKVTKNTNNVAITPNKAPGSLHPS